MLAFVATLIVLVATSLVYASVVSADVERRPELALRDWTQIWRGGQALARGDDPWPLVPTIDRLPWPYRDRNAYPLPALWTARALDQSPMRSIAFWWVFASVALAGVALIRRNLWNGLALASWPAFGMAGLLQWSGLLLAAARFDLLMPVAACKPNLGLCILAYKPTARRLAILLVIVGISLAVDPGWIPRWRAAAESLHYNAPVMLWQAGGPLLLLAALRWRTPEGRVLLALALVPHNLMGYEQLLLFLVCRRGRECLLLVVTGWLAWWQVTRSTPPGFVDPAVLQALFPVPTILLLYLPALAIVLLQRNPDTFELVPPVPNFSMKF